MTGSDAMLDNPVWFALTGPHAVHARGSGSARRYDSDVSVFSGLADRSTSAWSDLAPLTTGAFAIVVAPDEPDPPAEWTRRFAARALQMWLPRGSAEEMALPDHDPSTGARVSMRALGGDDVDELSALVALTEPGPFRPRTIDLGGYVGIFHDGVLVAAAGQRVQTDDHCEVSAVCTHPDARRRGYGLIVTAAVAAAISRRGQIPFLHVVTSNTSAIAVYEKLGFTTRRVMWFAALQPPT